MLGGSVVLVVGGEAVLGRDVCLGGMTREAELCGGIVAACRGTQLVVCVKLDLSQIRFSTVLCQAMKMKVVKKDIKS